MNSALSLLLFTATLAAPTASAAPIAPTAILATTLALRPQSQAWTVLGTDQGDNFGHSIVSTGDRDGDGITDLLVGSPESDPVGPASGQVTLLSGATGAVLLQVPGLATGDRAGRSVAALGDINADSIPDLAFGAPTRSTAGPQMGAAFVVSGADGSILLTYEGATPYGVFGLAIANAGDLDGDGRDDLLIGAPNEDPNGADSGAVYILSTASQNGPAIHTLSGANPGDRFGSMLLSVGDTNNDGTPDFLVGSPDETASGATSAGAARLYSGADMSPLGAWFGSSAHARFGAAACALGDWNSDGRADFAIGAPGAQDPNTGSSPPGRVELRSGANGNLLLAIDGPAEDDFGSSLAACGDANSDGTPDLLVGAPTAGTGGEVLTISGLDGTILSTTTSAQPNARQGHALASLSAPSDTGTPDWTACAPLQDSASGADHGAVTLFSDSIQLGATFCAGDGSAAPCPCGNTGDSGSGCANGSGLGGRLRTSGSASLAADILVLEGSQLIGNQPGLYFQGNNAVNSGSGNQFGDGLRCAGGGVIRLQVRFASSTGTSSTNISIATKGGCAAGDLKRYQLWYRDPISTPCGTAFNLSNGVEITWVP